MRIPTHQIHNVLNAYAKRLKKIHDAGNVPAAEAADDQINSYSVESKRRWIINKISSDIIERIARTGSRQAVLHPDAGTTAHPFQPRPVSKNPPPELIRYHIITPDGKKISANLKVHDSEFLIRQLEEIARNSTGK